MQMYFDYLKEREGVDCVAYEYGFALVKLVSTGLYIQDIYVVPERRGEKLASKMLADIEAQCVQKNIEQIIGSCDTQANGATHSIKTMLATGFQLSHCDGNLIYLTKKLSQKEN